MICVYKKIQIYFLKWLSNSFLEYKLSVLLSTAVAYKDDNLDSNFNVYVYYF